MENSTIAIPFSPLTEYKRYFLSPSWKTAGSLNWFTGVFIALATDLYRGKFAPSHFFSGLNTSIGFVGLHDFIGFDKFSDSNLFDSYSCFEI